MKLSCLAKDKLHLNKTGNSIFAKNIINVLKKVWYNNKHVEQVNGVSFTDVPTTSPEYKENSNATLKRLRDSHLDNIIFSYLNISSIRNKFGDLDKIVDRNIFFFVYSRKEIRWIFSQ